MAVYKPELVPRPTRLLLPAYASVSSLRHLHPRVQKGPKRGGYCAIAAPTCVPRRRWNPVRRYMPGYVRRLANARMLVWLSRRMPIFLARDTLRARYKASSVPTYPRPQIQTRRSSELNNDLTAVDKIVGQATMSFYSTPHTTLSLSLADVHHWWSSDSKNFLAGLRFRQQQLESVLRIAHTCLPWGLNVWKLINEPANMNAEDCGLGYQVPTFHDVDDLDKIQKAFYKDGIAYVQGVDEAKLVALGNYFGSIIKPRNETGNGTGISNIRFAPGLEGKGYSSQELFFHTDRSGWDLPPRVLITTLKVQAISGGHSMLVDGQALLRHLRLNEPFLYGLITSPKYSSFRSDDGTFTPRPIFDEATGILRLRFDDGVQLSATLIENWAKFRDAIYMHSFAIALSRGQSYIVDNHRFLHGRTSFTGQRELLRVLVDVAPPTKVVPLTKAILFDVDGTLVRAEALSKHAFFRALAEVSGRPITAESSADVSLHGVTDLSLARDVLSHHGVEDDKLQELTATFLQRYPGYLQDSLAKHPDTLAPHACTHVVDGLLALVSETRSTEHPALLGLLTGNGPAGAALKISAAGIDVGVFDMNVSSFGDTCGSRLALFQDAKRALEARIGAPVDPRNVMLIGDTPLDIQCAKAVGARVVAIATGNYTFEALKACEPDMVTEMLPHALEFIKEFLGA
ncbi:hypothetical protein C8R45DRAFT_1073427 [Mycena sanguinolenta]|nr:hypothetical protein C8R45DRAFT_1073427 [Mycena sanguinolenta]